MVAKREKTIDEHSPEFLFGRIMTRLEQGDRTMENLATQVGGLTKAVSDLPCKERGDKIEDLEGWQKKRNHKEEEKGKMKISFRNALVIALISVGAAGLTSWLVSLATKPPV
jgi:hypothetical protein